MDQSIPYARADTYWIKPEEEAPPHGRKILLLTRNGVAVIGTWGEGYTAWHPLPKNKKPCDEITKAPRPNLTHEATHTA